MLNQKYLRFALIPLSALFLCGFLPKGCGKKETANIQLQSRLKDYQVEVNGSSVSVKDNQFAVPIGTELQVSIKKQGYREQKFVVPSLPKAGATFSYEVPVVPITAANLEALNAEEKKLVEEKYTELEAAHKAQNPQQMLELSQEVLDKVANYKDARRIQVEALQKLEDSHAGKKPLVKKGGK